MGQATSLSDRWGARRTERTELVDIGGLCLHYRDLGARSAPTALVLHGLMGHAWEWDVLASRLSTSHRVIVPDQRGHGFSEWSDAYTVDRFAADAIELLEHLGEEEVHLIGHSVGGLAAMLVAARRPDLVARLILVDASPDAWSARAVAASLRRRLLDRAAEAFSSIDEAVARWVEADASVQRDLVREFLLRSLARDARDRLVWSFDGVGLETMVADGYSAPVLWGAVDDLLAPTFLIRGHSSTVTTRPMVDQMADRLLRFEGLVEVAGAGHDLALQAPIAVAHHCSEYLARSR